MRVSALTDRDQIREFLLADRFFADYALGDLDPAHFPFTEWFGAEEDATLCAIVMLYHDLTPPILFVTGEARGIEALLDRVVDPPEIGISIREEHLPIIEKFYRADPIPMLKMALEPASLRARSAKQFPRTKRRDGFVAKSAPRNDEVGCLAHAVVGRAVFPWRR
jgi:hypothetical protein